MKILIVAATYIEIKGLLNEFDFKNKKKNLYSLKNKNNEVNILITGIGIAFTVYSLTKEIQNKDYNLIINIGIAGSFNKKINISEVVLVKEEQFADLGIENKDKFQTLFDIDFVSANVTPFTKGVLLCKHVVNKVVANILKVKAITVNTVSGNKISIEKLNKKFNADIETMEGAAFFYVCLMEKVKFIQIRAISNYVEERNKENWNIPLAVSNLTTNIKNILLELI